MNIKLLRNRIFNENMVYQRMLLVAMFFLFSAWGVKAQTVTTDKDDYSPGEYVIITGTGWEPGEQVDFTFEETPKPETCVNSHDNHAIADANGKIYYNGFLIKENHIGVAFVLTAIGQVSGKVAVTEFTDGNVRVKTSVGIISVEATFSSTTTCNSGPGVVISNIGSSGSAINVGVADANQRLFIRASEFNNLGGQFLSWSTKETYTTPDLNKPYEICVVGKNGTIDFTANYSTCTAPTISSQPQSNSTTTVYGSNVTFSTTASNAVSYQWQVSSDNGANWGDITGNQYDTSIPGELRITKPTVSMNGYRYRVTVTGNCTPNAISNGNATLTVNPKGLTINGVTASNKEYDGNTTATLTGTPTLIGVVNPDVVTVGGGSGSFATAGVGNAKSVTVTGYTLGGAGAANYIVSQPTGLDANITAKNIIITPTAGQSKVYGTTDPIFTYTPSEALLAGNSFTGALSRVAGETVVAGPYTYTIGTLSAGPNYSLSLGGNNKFAITPKALTATSTVATRKYDGTTAPGTVTLGTVTGLVGTETLSITPTASNYADPNAGTAKSTTISYSLSNGTNGGLASNYSMAPLVTAGIVEREKSTINVIVGDPYTFDNSAKSISSATVTGVGGSTVGSATVVYKLGSNTVSAPTNAGEYDVYASFVGNTNYEPSTDNSKKLLITKATPSVSLTSANYTFNGKTQGPDVASNTGTGENYSFSYAGVDGTSYGPNNAKPTNAGNYTVTATVAPSADGNYNTASSSPVAFSIDRAIPNVTAQAASELVYNATSKTGTGSALGVGTPAEVLTPVTLSYAGTGTTNYPVSTIAPTNAGSYTITATFAGNDNYITQVSNAIPFTITKKQITVTADSKSKVYGTSEDPELTYTVSGLLSEDNLTGNLSRVSGEDVGEYDILSTLANSNYNVTFASAKFKITPKAIVITPTAGQTKVYGQNDPAFGFSNDGGLTSAAFGATELGRTPGENVDSYTYTLGNLSAGANYKLSLAATAPTFTITPKALIISNPLAQSKIYDGNDAAIITGSLSGVVGSDAVTFNGTGKFESTDAGNSILVTSDATLSGAAKDNYTLTHPSGLTANITPKQLSITAPTIAAKVYDGQRNAGAVTVGTLSGFVGSETVLVSASAEFDNANAGDNKPAIVSYTLSDGTNGGKAGNYSLAPGSSTGNVSRAVLTAASTVASKIYDGESTAGAVILGNVSGLVGNETLNITAVASDYEDADAGDQKATTISYTLKDGANGGLASNYSMANLLTTGKINKAASSVNVAVGGPYTFDNTPKAIISATVVGIGGTSIGTATVEYKQGVTKVEAPTNAGIYDVYASFAGNINYDPSSDNSKQLIIDKAKTTTTLTVSDATYSGNSHGGDAQVIGDGGLNEAVTIYYEGVAPTAYQPSVTAPTNAGTYKATANYAESANHEASSDSKTFAIGKADAIINVSAYDVVYNGKEHSATFTALGVENSPADLSSLMDVSGTMHTNAGTYAADAWIFAGNGNYNASSGTVANKIGKAEAAIAVTGYTGIYDDESHGASGLVTGVNGEKLEGLNLGASFTNVPGGTANWVFTDATGNYKDESGSVAITIGKANAIINVSAYEVTYDGKEHSALGSAKGVKEEELSGLDLSGTKHIIAGTYGEDQWSFTDVTGNYNDVAATAITNKINKRLISVTPNTGQSKIYGSEEPIITFTPSEALLTGNNFTGALTREDGKNVGLYAYGLGTLTAGDNYTVSLAESSNKFAITPKSITASITASNKEYDGLLSATASGSVPSTEVITGDVVAVTVTNAKFTDKNVGVSKQVSAGVTISNNNYSLSSNTANTTSDITPKGLAVSATASNKVYDGTQVAVVSVRDNRIAGDELTVNYTEALFSDKHAGTGKQVTISGINLTGLDAGNYTPNEVATASADITKRPLLLSNFRANSKVYDGSTNVLGGTGCDDDRVAGDDLKLDFTALFSDKNVGTDKDVNYSGIVIAEGRDKDNYSLATATGVAKANITPKPLTITAPSMSKFCGQDDPTTGYNCVVNGAVIGETITTSYTINGTTVVPSSIDEKLINYAVTLVNGVLTVNGVVIDASASSKPLQVGNAANLSATISPTASDVYVTFRVHNDQGSVINIQKVKTINGIASAIVPASALAVGVYKVIAEAGTGCSSSIAYISVFDPTGNFVTGGGWINSPDGAIRVEGKYGITSKTATGKANFGFVAKYKKGSNQVDGNTEFQFNTGNINFKSTLHNEMSLVVTSDKATYRGEGTLNGMSGFKFTVIAIDGDVKGKYNNDKFRIRIWDSGNTLVYDNLVTTCDNLNGCDYDEASDFIGGGSIVIHENKSVGGGSTTSKLITEAKTDLEENGSFYNFPNAFSDRTTIAFSVDKEQSYLLEVYDVKGALVKRVSMGVAEANNLYEFDVDGRNLAEGIYIARLVTGSKSQSLKMILKK
ncbi:YDG domain-containing protein [Pontibacter sp. MBLB2868]|uniref:YDG domain-containing protein n=1 Tax=Pontibacter sp. MBLB2868 TaxID=3451555 RepID=UPI003F74B205